MRSFYVAEEPIVHDGSAGRAMIVAAGGEVDYASSSKLRNLLASAIHPDGTPLIVDLSDVTFIDSTAIGVLAKTVSRMSEMECAMALVCGNPRVLRIFQMVGLDEMVAIYDSRSEALGSLAQHG
jgi:anti-sigma B factor antagonist